MAFNQDLANRMKAQAGPVDGLSETSMFGGCGLLVNRNMACGVQKDFLMVRVGKDKWQDALQQPGVQEMDFTGRSMRGWVMIELEHLSDDGYLKHWVTAGLDYAASLPAKA